MEDLMDLENARLVVKWIKDGKVKLNIRKTPLPSPFATNLILQGYSDLIRIEDRQKFLRRMHEEHIRIIEDKPTDAVNLPFKQIKHLRKSRLKKR